MGAKCTGSQRDHASLSAARCQSAEANAGSIADLIDLSPRGRRSTPHYSYVYMYVHVCRYIPPQFLTLTKNLLTRSKGFSTIFDINKDLFTRLDEAAIMGRRGKPAGFDATEFKKRIDAVAAVVDFNDAHNVPYSKITLYKYYGIGKRTGSKWFSGGATMSFRKQPGDKSPSLKRSRSEDPADEIPLIKTDPDEAPTVRRQNPLRNGGRDREKLKAIVQELTERASSVSTPSPMSPPPTADASSPPPPRQLLTPLKAKRARRGKRFESQSGHEVHRMESVTDLKHENLDDDISGAV